MKLAAVLLAATLTASAAAQSAPATAPKTGPAAEVQGNYARVKVNILKSGDLMPADAYSFKPEPDIRVYARIINHVTEAQFRSCGIVNGQAPDAVAKPPADTASKDEIVAALKASFAECDKAYASVNETNAFELLSAGPIKRTRLGLLWGNSAHDMEQYAQLALYLRLKNITPPSVEK